MTNFSHDGFGVELHTLDVQSFVAKAHNLIHSSVDFSPGRDLQAVWQGVSLNNERMLSGRWEGAGQILKHTGVIVVHV